MPQRRRGRSTSFWLPPMTPTLGDFLTIAGQRIAAAEQHRGRLPAAKHAEVTAELDRLLTVIARYVCDGLDPTGAAVTSPVPTRQELTIIGIRLTLLHATESIHRVAQSAGNRADTGHPVAADLRAAADALLAGRDLVHTHDSAPSDAGSDPLWAPTLNARPIAAALMRELCGYAPHLARLTARLSRLHPTATSRSPDKHYSTQGNGSPSRLPRTSTTRPAGPRPQQAAPAHHPGEPAATQATASKQGCLRSRTVRRRDRQRSPAPPPRAPPSRPVWLAVPLGSRLLAAQRTRCRHHRPQQRTAPADCRRPKPPARTSRPSPGSSPPLRRRHAHGLAILANRDARVGPAHHRNQPPPVPHRCRTRRPRPLDRAPGPNRHLDASPRQRRPATHSSRPGAHS